MPKTLKGSKREQKILRKAMPLETRRVTTASLNCSPLRVADESARKPTGKVSSIPGKVLDLRFEEDEPRAFNQWPTEQQISEVCNRLIQIKRIGVQNEQHGDYFNSGDLAYQVHEILKATDELFRKSQRVKQRGET